MPNFEKYNKLHAEIMKRLEAGEITTEQAKEVNDLAFEKYITEDYGLDRLVVTAKDILKDLKNLRPMITNDKTITLLDKDISELEGRIDSKDAPSITPADIRRFRRNLYRYSVMDKHLEKK